MGFFEILIIAVIALMVVGPERMPEAVRNVALTIGRIKRGFNNAREELEKQVGADDIRRQLHNEAVMENLSKIKDDLSDIDKKIDEGEADMSWMESDNKDDDSQQQLTKSAESATEKQNTAS